MGLYKRENSPIWWISFYVQGKRYRISTGTENKKLADGIEAKAKTSVIEGKWFETDESRHHTFDELMDRFIKEHAPLREAKTQRSYKISLKHLESHFAGMILGDISAKHISAYIQLRREEGAAPATINRERAMLSKAFSLASRQWELCKGNPCSKVPPLAENNQIVRWLSTEDEAVLLKTSIGHLRGQFVEMIILALHAGMRAGEIRNLKWKDVDLFRKTIVITKPKNKEPRTIPMNETLFDLLCAKSKVINMAGYIFATSTGTKISERNLHRAWYKAATRAGIENFRFHDLRHTFATRLVQSGVDLYSVAKLLGHKDMKTTQRYAHHSPESMRSVVKILDGLGGKN